MRYITKEFNKRYIPEGYKKYIPVGEYKEGLFECYTNLEQPHNPRAIFYTGKQSKFTWNYRFATIEQMKKRIDETISRITKWEDMKLERRKQRTKEVLEIKVGDLFVSSWGYEQTNIDFYQCIEVKGKTFKVRPIAGESIKGSMISHGMADTVRPLKDHFLEESRYPILTKKSLKICSYQWLSKIKESDTFYRSWYA